MEGGDGAGEHDGKNIFLRAGKVDWIADEELSAKYFKNLIPNWGSNRRSNRSSTKNYPFEPQFEHPFEAYGKNQTDRHHHRQQKNPLR